MVFCGNCGQKTEESTKFCPVCGTPLHVGETRSEGGASNQPTTGAGEAGDRWRKLSDMPDSTADFDRTDIERNKVMGILAYFGILVLVPILCAKDSKFARYHANQGVILFIALAGWSIIDYVLTSVLWRSAGLWGVYSICSLMLNLVYIVFAVLAVIGIVNAVNGKAKELPVIGKYKVLR